MGTETDTDRTARRTMEKVYRLISFCGAWEDGTVRDYGYGIGEYSDLAESVFVIGYWWSRDPETGKLQESRLAQSLENVGAELLWDDEWEICSDCGRAYRTSADSYSWQPRIRFYESAYEWICDSCIDWEEIEEEYVNNSDNALTLEQFRQFDIVGAHGFQELTPTREWVDHKGNKRVEISPYENGWHAGQTDSPREILDSLSDDWDEIVFVLSETSQFYVRFRVFGRGQNRSAE